ncbi:MAG: hypothetical protein H8E17_17105 [Deltaproteobacteria bacterium]|nr:hypothetical protein [Deltaproteobacteria bacterium]
MQIELTTESILKDIEGYQTRISAAQNKLESLPAGRLPYPQHKRRQKQRRELEGEIQHVENLIRIANEAIEETA